MRQTLLLSGSDVENLLTSEVCIAAVEMRSGNGPRARSRPASKANGLLVSQEAVGSCAFGLAEGA